MSKKVGIVMGSDSDLPVMQKAIDTLVSYGVPYEVHVFSAHRTPAETQEFASSAAQKGFGVIIAAAGMAAHLAGAIAANTVLPVIGVTGRIGRSSVHRTDALGHSRCDGCHRREYQCGDARRADTGSLRRNSPRETERFSHK